MGVASKVFQAELWPYGLRWYTIPPFSHKMIGFLQKASVGEYEGKEILLHYISQPHNKKTNPKTWDSMVGGGKSECFFSVPH